MNHGQNYIMPQLLACTQVFRQQCLWWLALVRIGSLPLGLHIGSFALELHIGVAYLALCRLLLLVLRRLSSLALRRLSSLALRRCSSELAPLHSHSLPVVLRPWSKKE